MFLGFSDVTSLFTEVPVKRCFGIVCETIVEYELNVGMPIDLFKRLLELCVVHVQFMFNEKFFRQIDGVAMGSRLGSILANIFMGFIERKRTELIKESTIFYGCYVDDIVMIVKGKDELIGLKHELMIT